jgi:hypothetical protein
VAASHCQDILHAHWSDAPTHLGIDDHITSSTRVIKDELVENALFREFVDQFRVAHPEYTTQFRAIGYSLELERMRWPWLPIPGAGAC